MAEWSTLPVFPVQLRQTKSKGKFCRLKLIFIVTCGVHWLTEESPNKEQNPFRSKWWRKNNWKKCRQTCLCWLTRSYHWIWMGQRIIKAHSCKSTGIYVKKVSATQDQSLACIQQCTLLPRRLWTDSAGWEWSSSWPLQWFPSAHEDNIGWLIFSCTNAMWS